MLRITGKSVATVAQMKSYIKKVNPDVETKVINMIKYYIFEGNTENIRGDIAFAQSCLETGNFTFKGSAVTLDQNNFAGLGVTQKGMKGESWDTAQLGIRAQIQHLKAYANTENLAQECVDSRFKYVERGVAPYVEYLGIQENPSKKGWAAGANYGNKIINILNAILAIEVEETENEEKGDVQPMIEITRMITKKKCYVGQNVPSFVVVHETDNWSTGANAKCHATAMLNGNLAGTVHYYIDDHSCYQTLEHKDGAYAVGDGYGKYGLTNRNTINIEICVNKGNDYYKTVGDCQVLCAMLLKQYGWGIDRLKRHYDASHKHCPRRILDEGLWEGFVKNVEALLNNKSVKPIESTPVKKAYLELGDSGNEVKSLQEKLIKLNFKGKDGKILIADGDFGENTDFAVRAAQKKYDLVVDGLAGENTIKALDSAIASISSPTAIVGNKHIRNAQIHLNNFIGSNLKITGKKNSATKKAFRKAIEFALNKDYECNFKQDGTFDLKVKDKLRQIALGRGDMGMLVTVVEIGLLMNKIDPSGVECPGSFGSGLETAVKKFQKKKKLIVDGVVGVDTFTAMQK